MCDHVVHSASKYRELINILTNVTDTISPKAEHILTNPLLISTKKTCLPTLGQNVSQRMHVTTCTVVSMLAANVFFTLPREAYILLSTHEP